MFSAVAYMMKMAKSIHSRLQNPPSLAARRQTSAPLVLAMIFTHLLRYPEPMTAKATRFWSIKHNLRLPKSPTSQQWKKTTSTPLSTHHYGLPYNNSKPLQTP
jgi:hypothetical protein